jgi:hypothetical protein
MKINRISGILLYAAAALAVVLAGCSDGVITGQIHTNQAPEVWLSSGPVENDTTSYQVHFYWSGWDPDGELAGFEFVVAKGDPIGFSPADTAGLDKWTKTTSFDSIFRVAADGSPRPYPPNSLYTVFDRTHTFFIRAVDLEGKRSEPATRSFTAWTLAPLVDIKAPAGASTTYSTVITFRWDGRDPIDSPSNSQSPDSVRYLYSQVVTPENIYDPSFLIIDHLNANPEFYEDRWSSWTSYTAPGDSGRSTILGDDEILQINRSYIFAVQAKDEAGAVTAIFRKNHNVKQFIVSWKTGPLLSVTEPFLGGFRFIGTNLNPQQKQLPPGVPLNFSWSADASSYGGEISGYRYGWDVQDLSDPNSWEVNFSPYHKEAPERILYSGTHMFYIQVMDNGGRITLGRIEVEVIPFSMERDLLWVDDFPLDNTFYPNMVLPTESVHDEFWLNICGMAPGFMPQRDVIDCADLNFKAPDMERIGKYKNIIWTYSSSNNTTLGQIIKFTPESMIGEAGTLPVNYLSIFLTKGGHLWLLGRSDRAGGGLSLIFPQAPLFPASFKYDMAGTESDTSGVNCMGYRDFCVSVVDKVTASFRTGAEMPARSLERDALRHIVKETGDPMALEFPEMPAEVRLSAEVTCPSCFFNPQVRGFTYVEMYDTRYWMETRQIDQRSCFHPLYRMRARNTTSAVDYAVVALVLSKYSDKVPDVMDGTAVAANSFHFGLPLWFFDHESVYRIANSIFEEWGILAEEEE